MESAYSHDDGGAAGKLNTACRHIESGSDVTKCGEAADVIITSAQLKLSYRRLPSRTACDHYAHSNSTYEFAAQVGSLLSFSRSDPPGAYYMTVK